MSNRHPLGRGGRALLAVAASTSLAVAGLGAAAGGAAAAPGLTADPAVAPSEAPAATPQEFADGSYLVVMKAEPVAAYDGGVPGLRATKPAPGQKVRGNSPAARAYRAYLQEQKQAAKQRADVRGATTYEYDTALTGFAADLSAEEARALAKDDAVLAVVPDEKRQLDTVASPEMLGLTGPGGVWEQVGGLDDTADGAGAGVVVGIIDSGISPDNPSFAGDGFTTPSDWAGECETENDPAFQCNDKLIGARYFVDGFGASGIADYEVLSPRDADGHGTHTAGTAAGNDGVSAVIDGVDYGQVSGMAPEAHVAAYKVCWDGADGGGGCYSSDSAAAIEAAVEDGVDVLNFSISGTSSNFLDPVELAFMFAADAGVFVAASSGNSGPAASTTNHPSPWLTTVAASTHVVREATLVTGDDERYIGSSIAQEGVSAPMVLSWEIPAAGASAQDATQCNTGAIDPAAAAGKIVVCQRLGLIARTIKSQTVADAGGVGMVLINRNPSSLDTDIHAVPTVHLQNTALAAVTEYVSGDAGATGEILAGVNEGSTTQVPEIAGFSSRGPTSGAGGDLLKPDVSAPGVGVLAAYSPRPAGRDFDFLSGTSMSSPHIAGLAALIRDAHPDWSPMAVKSAMMTTARDHASAASSDLFAQGAGFVEPRRFLSPGLVYDAGQTDWWAFLAGQGVRFSDGTPVSPNPIDASDLNLPSIAIGSLAGKQAVTRTVTNVGDRAVTYRAKVEGVSGVDVAVSPSRLTLRPGQSADFSVTFTRTSAAFGAYAKGHLTWVPAAGRGEGRGSVAEVRSPIAVRPVAAAVPAEVALVDGAAEIAVTSGFAGTMSTQVKGLVAGTVTEATAQNTGGADFSPTDPRNATVPFTVPAGTTLTRVELRAENPALDDLDLFVQRVGGGVVAQAASGAANERITTTALPAGDYIAHVQAWAVAGGAPTTTFDVRTFAVPDADAGNATVDPATVQVTSGSTATFGVSSTVDASTTPYLGWVGFYDGSTLAGRTIVSAG